MNKGTNATATSWSWDSLDRKASVPECALSEDDHWMEIPGKFFHQEGVIRLREPAGANLSDLLQSLRNGSYTKPYVFDDGVTRRLHFDFQWVQSEMKIEAPDELTFTYTQKMMAFLLFLPNPRHVLIVGLGGGSLTKFCYRQLPRARVTTVEIDKNVIGLAEIFKMPAPDLRMRIIHADAAEYLSQTNDRLDVVLIDGCDKWGTAPIFCEPFFYERVLERLQPYGMLVINLVGLENRIKALLQTMDEFFANRYLVLDVLEGSNCVLFIFNSEAPREWSCIKRRAEALELQHGLDFPLFARRLQRNDQC